MNIEPTIYQILVSRKFTSSDREMLKYALLEGTLTDSEYDLMDRLFYGVRHGLLMVAEQV